MDDAPTPFQPQVSQTPEEDLLEQNTREGLRALFHWAVFPFPLAVIPLAWASQLPVAGFLFGFAAFAVLIVWAIRAYGAWGDRAWPFVAQVWEVLFAAALKGFQKVSRGTQSESAATPTAVEDARIEGTTAVRAALMDTVEADIQVAGQLAAFRTQIDRLTLLNAESTTLTEEQRRTNELVIRQLRRNIADVEKAEAERTGVSLETHGPRPLFDALLPAEAAPAPRLGFFAAPSLPIGWIVAALAVAIGLVQTVRVERVKNDARDLQGAVAAETDRANAAETQARMNEVALESTRHEVNVSRELNETLQARQERLEARQRRSSREQVDAARSGRPVDLDGRLRDFGIQPLASPDLGAGPAPDPASGVHERPAGALDLSTPGALPTGDDGASARDSNVPG